MREGTYFIPKRMFGRPVDVVYAFWSGRLPAPLLQSALKLWLRLVVGRWEDYGLPAPTHAPLEERPTVNSSVLEALRHGRLVARRGIERYDGHTVHFTDGTQEDFDVIIMATGFRASFPFLSKLVAGWDTATTPPFHLKMMHPTIPSLFFIGLFQPIGCIWQLADYQARIVALQLSGRLQRPAGLAARIHREIATEIIGSTRRPGTRSRSTIAPSGASSWTNLPPPRREAQGRDPADLIDVVPPTAEELGMGRSNIGGCRTSRSWMARRSGPGRSLRARRRTWPRRSA